MRLLLIYIVLIVSISSLILSFYTNKRERYIDPIEENEEKKLEILTTLPEEMWILEILPNLTLRELNRISRQSTEYLKFVRESVVLRYNIPLSTFNNAIYYKYTDLKEDIAHLQNMPEPYRSNRIAEDERNRVIYNQIFNFLITTLYNMLNIIGVDVRLIPLSVTQNYPEESKESRRLLMIDSTNFPVSDDPIMHENPGKDFAFYYNPTEKWFQIFIRRGTNVEMRDALNNLFNTSSAIFEELKEGILDLWNRAHLILISHSYINPNSWGTSDNENENTIGDFYSFNLNQMIRFFDAEQGYDQFSNRFPKNN